MAKVKEVWVRFSDTETYYEKEGELLSILSSASGDCVVKVYIENMRSCKELCDWSFDKEQLFLLTDVFGEENVRYQEKEIKKEIQWSKPKKVPNIRQVLPCNDTMYAVMTDGDGEQYKCKVLMYALCDDGEIYPLYFDSWLGISPLYEAAFDVELYEMENGVIYSPEGRKTDEQK